MSLKVKFAGVLAMMAITQPAIAETVVMSCTITSSELTEPKPGQTLLFKIGDGKWQEWAATDTKWVGNRCAWFSFVRTMSCTFSPIEYETYGVQESPPGYHKSMIRNSAVIDRRTGSYSEEHFMAGEEIGLRTSRVSGTCVKADDPEMAKRNTKS